MTMYERARLIHRAWRYRLRTERQEIAFVRALSQPGDLVIDVGAHRGAFTYWMAKAVGKNGLVLAFEPLPELTKYLMSMAKNYNDGRIRVFGSALSNFEGMATLHLAGHHLGTASLEIELDVMGPPIEVETTMLDACLARLDTGRTVSLIKCDVEHHELAVFQGARATLQNSKPFLVFESGNLQDEQHYCRPVFQFLESLGFVGYFFSRSSLVPLHRYDPGLFPVVRTGNQNYAFVHKERLDDPRTRRLKLECV
jgi:FkbM family methyltransferase